MHKVGIALAALIVPTLLTAESLSPVSTRRLEGETFSVAWLDQTHLLLAGREGVRKLSLRDGVSTELISVAPIPEGLPHPSSVVTDGKTVVASNGLARMQFACSAATGKRLFARSAPSPMVVDLAVSGDDLFILGWPLNRQGADQSSGIALWRGKVNPHFEVFAPFHRIQSGPEAIAIFNDSLPVLGGALAIEPDGTLDVITSAEPGLFQYSPAGVLKRALGVRLGELVMRRMHDINFTYSVDEVGRYRDVINRQPTIDDLVATSDGPAIVVRIVRNDSIEWELWYPNQERVERKVKLGISRRGPFGHLACDARGRDLACVYAAPQGSKEAAQPDQSRSPQYLVQFKLPPRDQVISAK
jgi:hypothetical protein